MRVKINSSIFAIFWFSWSLLLSFVIRSNKFDVDMVVYAQSLNYTNYSYYILREPIVWLGTRLLFYLTQSSIITFLIFDLLSFIAIFLGLRALKAPRYYYFLLYIMPFVFFGIQNIYRQYLAMSFLFACYALCSRFIPKLFFSTSAILSHNSAILFVPLLSKRRQGIFYIFFTVFLLNILLVNVDVNKSGRAIGYDLSLVFTCFVAVLLAIHMYVRRSRNHTPLFVFGFLLLALGSTHLESSQIERLGYYLLFIMVPIVLTDLDNGVTDVTIFRFVVIQTVVGVMLGFPATMVFISW